jgi:hypothetical protein
MPSAVSAEFERETGDKGRWQLIGDSGTLRLGKTTFQLQPGESKSESEPVFQAETEVDGQTVTATIRFARSLPLVNVDLASPADWKLPDLWAHTVFGNDFLDLDDPQKALVTKATEIQLLAIEAETKSKAKPASVETGEPSIDDSADDELDEAKGSDEPEADSKSDEEPDTKGV